MKKNQLKDNSRRKASKKELEWTEKWVKKIREVDDVVPIIEDSVQDSVEEPKFSTEKWVKKIRKVFDIYPIIEDSVE